MNTNHLNIPVSVCIHAVQQNCVQEFQLFCWLKLNCNHRFKLNNQLTFAAIRQLKITKQTLLRRMEWLLRHKWLTYNSRSDSYHLNSFRIIHRKTRSAIKKGVLWENYNIMQFKAFIWAGIIGYYAKRKFFLDHHEIRLTDRGKTRARMKQVRPVKSSGLCPLNLPLEYLAKAINIPKSTLHKNKELAKLESFIKVENNFDETNLSVSALQHLRTFASNEYNIRKLVVKDGKVKEQLPDKIYLGISLNTKRNLKQN